MKIKTETQTGSIVSFKYDDEIAEITGLTASFEPKQDGTPWMSDLNQTPYLLRQSPQYGYDYDREIDTLVGGTVEWNQLMNPSRGSASGTYLGIPITKSDGKITINGTSNASGTLFNFYKIEYKTDWAKCAGHKVFFAPHIKGYSGDKLFVNFQGFVTDGTGIGFYAGDEKIVSVSSNVGSFNTVQIYARVTEASVQLQNVTIEPVFIDLTAFNSEIADYVYSLEQSTSGSGVAWLKEHFPKLFDQYHAYDAGSLVSVKTSEHRTVGFNLWDEEWEVGTIDSATGSNVSSSNTIRSKNYIPMLGGVTYCCQKSLGIVDIHSFFYYDGNKNYIGYQQTSTASGRPLFTPPSNCCYMRFRTYSAYGTTYKNDICINISKTTGTPKNGDYVAYDGHSYPLNSDLELRGIPKLSNGSLYYDGDVYESSGAVTRKYGIKTFNGSESWAAPDSSGICWLRDDTIAKHTNYIGHIIATVPTAQSRYSLNQNYDSGITAYEAGTTDNYWYIKQPNVETQSAASLKAWLAQNPVTAVYELATPTTETADSFTSPQIVDPNGTEEYVDERSVPVPVGHRTAYMMPYPISGWDEVEVTRTGFNIWDEEWEVGSIDGNTGDSVPSLIYIRSKNKTRVVPNATYYFNRPSGNKLWLYGYDANKNFVYLDPASHYKVLRGNVYEYTIPSNVYYIRFIPDDAYGTTYNHDICINISKTTGAPKNGDYESYKGNIYTINLNGTRYGGDIDFFSGVMTLDKGYVTLNGSESWVASGANGYAITRTNAGITDVKVASSANTWCISNLFEKSGTTWTNKRFGIDNGTIWVGDTNFAIYGSLSNFKASLSHENLKIVYELAEPIEVQLTAEQIEALQGQNNVWANCGDITLTWRHIPVLDEAVMLNGKYLELTIDGYSTLGTSGRRSLGRQLDTYSVGTADGETVKNSTFPSRKITVNYVIQTDTEEELTEAINQLANILNQDECDFVFRDESDKFFSGYGLLDSEPKKYRHAVKGTWSLYCAYPFKRSNKLVELSSKDPTVASVDAHSATFVFDYNGTLPAHPILRAEFASAKSGGEYNEDGDCGYVAFLDAEENIIQLGNPEVLDVDQYANATLVNREFTSLSGWTVSGVTVGDLTDQFWQNGKGQTQSYAKGTGSFTKSVGNGAINMEFDIVHRLCVSAANQTGAFECYAKNGNTIVVGFKIEKTGSGTTGVVSYILNGKVVGTDSIDLSYYNTHFGYCNRTAVYGTEYYSVYEKYYVKKKGKKKKKYHWVTYPRTVQTGWSYTQSNLNSGWSKDGSVIVFSIGNLADRTFKNSDVELTPSTSIVFNISGSFHTNAVHSCAMLSKAGVPFAEIPNVFTAGDVVEGDCNSADVMLYRAGSLEGHLEPQYGALGNDWEDFEIKPGKNIIRAVWSDWVNTSYKPEIKIIFNEVYV